MGLPVVACTTGQAVLPDGQTVDIRGLTRTEALAIRAAMGDGIDAVEKLTIAAATATDITEVDTWYATAPQDAVEALVNAIAKLSGLDGDAGKDEGADSRSAPSTDSTTSSPKPSARA